MTACRWLPHETNDGPTNMALDEALLDSVANHPEAAVIRTYDWSIPTLSLGYFQSITPVDTDPRWVGQAIVRRPTGGGALWHDREITYAVVVPASHPLARPSTALYQAVHAGIAARLQLQGVAAVRRGADFAPPGSLDDRPFLCFQDKDGDDVVVGPVKLVGSAQRRRAGAVLQHGSLLLARSPITPELPGLRDLAAETASHDPSSETPAHWSLILRDVLAEVIGGEPAREVFSDRERDRADNLRKTVYANQTWTRRR